MSSVAGSVIRGMTYLWSMALPLCPPISEGSNRCRYAVTGCTPSAALEVWSTLEFTNPAEPVGKRIFPCGVSYSSTPCSIQKSSTSLCQCHGVCRLINWSNSTREAMYGNSGAKSGRISSWLPCLSAMPRIVFTIATPVPVGN